MAGREKQNLATDRHGFTRIKVKKNYLLGKQEGKN